MFGGRIGKWIRDIEFKLAGSFVGAGACTPTNGYANWTSFLTSYSAATGSVIQEDTKILIQSNQFVDTSSVQFLVGGVADGPINWTWTGSGYMASITAELKIKGVKIYVTGQRSPGTYPFFDVFVDSVEAWVNGSLVQTFSGFELQQASVNLQPIALPILGFPPVIGGTGANAGGAGDSTLYAAFGWQSVGGYRFIDQLGNAYAPPVNCSTVPTPTSDFGIYGPSMSASTTYNASLTAFGDIYDPAITYEGRHGNWSQQASLMLVPDVLQGYHKLGPKYLALIERLSLGGYGCRQNYAWQTAVGSDVTDSGNPVNTTNYLAPKTDGILGAVGDATHAVEGPFAYHLPAPYRLTAGGGWGTRLLGNRTETVTSVFPAVVQAPSPTNWLTYGGTLLGGAPDWWTFCGQMLNSWYALGWSYFLFFPLDSETGTGSWKVDGAAEAPGTYWLPFRQQAMHNPYLPDGENTGQRAQIVTDALLASGLANFMSIYVSPGQFTSWVGICRFQPVNVSPPDTITLNLHDLYHVKLVGGSAPGTLAFSGSGVTVTPNSGVSNLTLQIELWAAETGLGYYNAVCDRANITPPVITGAGAAAAFWAGYPLIRVPIALGSGAADHTKPVGNNNRFMGSWVEDWGQTVVTDVGADVGSAGDSTVAYADGTYGLVNDLAQPFGTNRQYLRLEFDLSGLSDGSSVFLAWPVLKRATGQTKAYYDQAARAFVQQASSGMWRWGVFGFWDPVTGTILDWPQLQPNTLSPSVLDGLGTLSSLYGQACTTNLATQVAGLYDNPQEYTQLKHLASDPFTQSQFTHSLIQEGSGGQLMLWMVNSFSEVPPIAGIPEPARHADTWKQDPALGFDNRTYTQGQAQRIVGEPTVGSRSSVLNASGTPLALTDLATVTGWRAFAFEEAPDDGTPSGFHLSAAGGNRAMFRPWRGLIWTGLPDNARACGYDISNSFGHVRTFVKIGEPNFRIGHSANLISWTDIDSGLAATWARPRFADLGEEWIGVMYGDGSAVHFARTRDRGLTWVDSTDLGDGYVGDFDEGANGLKWFFKVKSSDSGATWDVWGQLRDNQLNVVKDWTITDVTGIDNGPIAVREGIGPDHAWRIGLLYFSAGDPVTKFSKNGLAFS